jgi:hypothetical protein
LHAILHIKKQLVQNPNSKVRPERNKHFVKQFATLSTPCSVLQISYIHNRAITASMRHNSIPQKYTHSAAIIIIIIIIIKAPGKNCEERNNNNDDDDDVDATLSSEKTEKYLVKLMPHIFKQSYFGINIY